MIIDKLDNILEYESLLQGIKNGMQAIKALKSYDVGRYEFDGGFYMIQKGMTRPISEGTFEAHRKYIDVQIVIEGAEEVAWNSLDDLSECVPYNAEKDNARYQGSHDHVMKITAGMFYAAFPKDGHQPVCHTIEPMIFTKIVMKLPVKV